MIKIVNFFLVMMLLVSGTSMYSLEHVTRGMEREIRQLDAEIEIEAEQIKLLHAEWSSLTRPERIHMLATRKLGMKPLGTQHLILPSQVTSAVPERPPSELATGGLSPLSELLENSHD
jgi:cell division protein FtsL